MDWHVRALIAASLILWQVLIVSGFPIHLPVKVIGD